MSSLMNEARNEPTKRPAIDRTRAWTIPREVNFGKTTYVRYKRQVMTLSQALEASGNPWARYKKCQVHLLEKRGVRPSPQDTFDLLLAMPRDHLMKLRGARARRLATPYIPYRTMMQYLR